jgi:hypothetical protein
MDVNYFEKYGFPPIACRIVPGDDPVRGAAHTAVVAGRRWVTETPDAGDQRRRELSSLLAVMRMRTEALLAEGKDADAGAPIPTLESVRSSVVRARDLLGCLQGTVAPAAPSGASGARLRVLVIDDNREYCEARLDAMGRGGCRTLRIGWATSGEAFRPGRMLGNRRVAIEVSDPGLGLALTHKIVEDHGGGGDFHSVPGAGSTFRIVLPTMPTVAAAADEARP